MKMPLNRSANTNPPRQVTAPPHLLWSGCLKRHGAMKSLVFAFALVSACCVHAEAPSPSYSFKELASCSQKPDPYRLVPTIRAKRLDGRVVTTIQTSAGCSESAKPKVVFLGAAVSVGIDTYHQDGPIAACLCSRKFEFTLLEPVKTGTVIYFVQNGNAHAHAVAP
jgi:hypothetical protein